MDKPSNYFNKQQGIQTMLIPRLLYISSIVVGCASAAWINYQLGDLYAKQDGGGVTSSTSASENVETSASDGSATPETFLGCIDTTTESTESPESSSETETSTEETTSFHRCILPHKTTTSSESETTSDESSPSKANLLNPTYCEVTRNTLTPEEEVQLQVLFSDRAGASAFADYVVSYASQLIAQIDSVANIAVGDNNYAFTTAFDTIDVPGVLGLASAAPIYTCFLSTLWAQALANPQQYTNGATPIEDEKIKLIVLFEKRENDGMQFDYAELLVDDTNSLISDVQSVAGAAGAAAVNGDPSAYASLFANVDVAQFLSIATEAPIYTEGLSDAIQGALSSLAPVTPVHRVTTETVTLANGRVETRTVTICVENCETAVA